MLGLSFSCGKQDCASCSHVNGDTCAGKQQEDFARQAGFAKATHYEIGFGLMGTLVASKQ